MRTRLASVGISLLSACGGGDPIENGPLPDAAAMSPDSAPDANQEPVDLSCSLQTGRASILAVLHDADGAIQSTKTTDATGRVSWDECPANAFISYASLDQNSAWHGATIASVQPGDHFEVILEDSDVMTNVLVSIPIDGADVSFIRAQVGGGCYLASSEGATADVKLSRDCLRGSTDVPVLASGKIGSVPVFSYGSAAAMVEGGDTIVNNMTPWMTGPQVNLSASNVPSNSIVFYATAAVGGRVYGGSAVPKPTSGGAASAALTIAPSGFSTARRVSVATTTNGSERGLSFETGAYEASFDLSKLLPEITGFSADDSDPTRPLLAIGGDFSAADAGLFFIEWTTNEVPVYWRIMFPASTTSTVRFPQLPPELTGGAPANVSALRMAVLDVTDASYADLLTRGYHFYEYNHDCPALPAGSECRYVSYTAK